MVWEKTENRIWPPFLLVCAFEVHIKKMLTKHTKSAFLFFVEETSRSLGNCE